ncbi:hypothetical protein [Amycolatopsis regifaucium]|uniref:hypothetical protein n=1 Tax=Amycolatopsis regifaucium TaxID=546365 RepID=UPI0008F63DF3|nr:hypothetical protein [Amycolatopsis regifaucium]SFI64354.1 hypothetical protein SAMN04489731_11240 [Amycolatopsis regifaucium]
MSNVKHRIASILTIIGLCAGAVMATSTPASAISDCHGWTTTSGARAICGSTAGATDEMRVVAYCPGGSVRYGNWVSAYYYSDAYCPGGVRARTYGIQVA